MPTRNDRAHVPHRRAPISIVKDYLVSAVGEQLHHVAAVPTVGIPHPRTRPSVCALRGTPRATRATRRPAWRRRWSRPCTEGWPGPGRRGTMIELPSSFDDSIFRSAAVPPEETGEDLAGGKWRVRGQVCAGCTAFSESIGDFRIEAQIAPLQVGQQWVMLGSNLNVLVVGVGRGRCRGPVASHWGRGTLRGQPRRPTRR